MVSNALYKQRLECVERWVEITAQEIKRVDECGMWARRVAGKYGLYKVWVERERKVMGVMYC